MAVMRNLVLACATALLATGAHAGSTSYSTSYGVLDCGKKTTRTIAVGSTFECCSVGLPTPDGILVLRPVQRRSETGGQRRHLSTR